MVPRTIVQIVGPLLMVTLTSCLGELGPEGQAENRQLLGAEYWDSTWPGADPDWCYGANRQAHLGDFDGDGYTDMLCYRTGPTGRLRIDYVNNKGSLFGTNWDSDSYARSFGWNACDGAGDDLYVGNFSSDGKADLLCHTASGARLYDYQYGDYLFDDTPVNYTASRSFCGASGDTLHIGDFDNNGRDDVLCHTASGRRVIDFAGVYAYGGTNGWVNSSYYERFDFDSAAYPAASQRWCVTGDETVHVGDFNADGKDDLLCYNPATGRRRVDHANSAGTFFRTNWNSDSVAGGQPIHCGTDPSILIQDFNGDGRDDFFCYNRDAYQIQLSFSDETNGPRVLGWSVIHDWCDGEHETIYAGVFNRDRDDAGASVIIERADLLCHNAATGRRDLLFAGDEGDFNGVCLWPEVGQMDADYHGPSYTAYNSLGRIPIHFVVLVDANTPNWHGHPPAVQSLMPAEGTYQRHPLDPADWVANGDYFWAEVDLINASFGDPNMHADVGEDQIRFVSLSYTWFDEVQEILDAGDCEELGKIINPPDRCWTESNSDGNDEHGNPCVNPAGNYSTHLNFAMNQCEHPDLVHPRALNFLIYDNAGWSGGAGGAPDFLDTNRCSSHGNRNSFKPYVFLEFERFFSSERDGIRADAFGTPFAGGSCTTVGRAEEHEIGHALGLYHVDSAGNFMTPGISSNRTGGFATGWIDATDDCVAARYGCATSSTASGGTKQHQRRRMRTVAWIMQQRWAGCVP